MFCFFIYYYFFFLGVWKERTEVKFFLTKIEIKKVCKQQFERYKLEGKLYCIFYCGNCNVKQIKLVFEDRIVALQDWYCNSRPDLTVTLCKIYTTNQQQSNNKHSSRSAFTMKHRSITALYFVLLTCITVLLLTMQLIESKSIIAKRRIINSGNKLDLFT